MYPSSKFIALALIISMLSIADSKAQPGNSCATAGDISDKVIPDDPLGYGLTIDTRNDDQFIAFTAPTAGTLQFDQGYNGITYLIAYDDQCLKLDEKLLWYSYDVFNIELEANELVILECDRRNNVASKEVLNAVIHFQERVEGESPAEAIPLTEGTNQVTRYLGNQYFKYETTAVGSLTIKTCVDGNGVDGTNLTLYDGLALDNPVAANIWCSNDPDGDLAQSQLTYEVTAKGQLLILEASQVPFWFESYGLEFDFESAEGKSCELPITVTAGETYEIDHAPAGAAYQEAFWYAFTANESGSLTLTNCEQTESITKVTAFENCGGTNLGVADSNCNGGAELTLELAEGDEVVFKWDDHNEPDWNPEDYQYSFDVNFEPEPVQDGQSCATAFSISDFAIYNVDNSAGDQWFRFTAPETAEIAITTGPNGVGWGEVNLANGQDTKFKVFDACGGTILVQNDDSPVVKWRRSYATLEVTADTEYLIQWEDQFVNDPFQYQFEIFKVADVLGHASEEEAEPVDVGVHRALLNYKNHHWFRYTFPAKGVLVAVNRDELTGRVIPSYQMLYGENGLDLEIPDKDELAIENWSDSEPTETNFMYEGASGEEVLIRVEEVAGIHFYSVGNRDFELAFFEDDKYDDLCYYESELTLGEQEISSADGDQKYKYTATESGKHIFAADDNPSILISVHDACFGDALYTKYNDFYFEKQMEVGDEVYLIFSDEFGGACNFEIRVEDPCKDEVTTEIEACDEYTFADEVLITSGSYEATFTNQAGCDSLVNLTLTILESTTSESIVAACESYDWNGTTYDATGIYEVLFENSVGCDSVAVLDLTILEATSSESMVDACESYDWNGLTYDATGVYEVLLENSVGCDSVAVLDLTILESNSSESVVETCESYDWNGTTYDATGVYEVLLENSVGCDSVAVLDLTILEATSSESLVEACESYDWNGSTYDATGVYEVLLENASGCDSMAVLDLTILESSSSTTLVESYTAYEWNGEIYEATGVYETILINEAGCDSLAQLDLTILERNSQTIAFDLLTGLSYGQEDLQLMAVASSGLEVTYESSDETIASINGTILQIHAAGELQITASQAGDEEYQPASVTIDASVAKAILNVQLHDELRLYGTDNPEWSLSYDGFVNDDNENDLQSIPTASSIATTTSDVGSYEITASGGVADNYDFNYLNGTLVIEQADQQLDFEPFTNRTYGDVEFDLLAEASSGLSVTFLSSDEQVAVINGHTVEIVGAGASTITAVQAGNQNFNAIAIEQELVVSKASLTIRADDQRMHERQQLPDLTMSLEGLVRGETVDHVDLLPSISTEASAESEVGMYDIYLEGGAATNYELNLVNGILTVDVALSTSTELRALQIYPNPPTDQLHIDLPQNQQQFPVNVTIRDSGGRVFYRSTELTHQIVIDMEPLPKGLLFLYLQVNGELHIEQLIKR